MLKKIIIVIISVLTLLSCSENKKELIRLNTVMKNVEIAQKSSDEEFINLVLDEMEYLMTIFKKHQSLREKKYKLEVKIKDYDGAIKTIDDLLRISKEDIDNRIVQAILLEIVGSKARSVEVLEEVLILIDKKIKRMHPNAREKRLKREINRIFVLKLLNRDSENDYIELENSELAKEFPAIAKVIEIVKLGSRDQIINRYR